METTGEEELRKSRFEELLGELARCYEVDVAHARHSQTRRVSIQDVAENLERSRSLPGSIGSGERLPTSAKSEGGLVSVYEARPGRPQRGDFKSRKSTAKMSLASLQGCLEGGCLTDFQLHVHPQLMQKAPDYPMSHTRSSAVSPRPSRFASKRSSKMEPSSFTALHPEAGVLKLSLKIRFLHAAA